MRYTHQWHPDGGCTEAHCLGGHLGTVSPLATALASKLEKLPVMDRMVLIGEIAAAAEQAYRRGFQQGTVAQSGDGPWSRNPKAAEVADFRFDIPLEFAAPTPGYYANGDGVDAEKLARSQNPVIGSALFTSAGRLGVEARNCSPLIDYLTTITPLPNAEIDVIWGPGREVDRLVALFGDAG